MKGKTWLHLIVLCGLLVPGLLPVPTRSVQAVGALQAAEGVGGATEASTTDDGQGNAPTGIASLQGVSDSCWQGPVTVDAAEAVGMYTSLAVVDGRPAISFFDETNNDLKYVRAQDSSGATWGAPVTVDAEGDVGMYTSLVVVEGRPAISYIEVAGHVTFFMYYVRAQDSSGTTWGAPVYLGGGIYPSLAVVDGRPAISYWDYADVGLKYVRAQDSSGTTWGAPVMVDAWAYVDESTSLAEVDGRPAISYHDSTLKYVRAQDPSGSTWGAPVTVDAAVWLGGYPSLAVVDGRPAISYFDETNNDLKYVRAQDSSGSTWGAPVTVDAADDVGMYTSLAVVDGRPAISYFDETNNDLKYVRARDPNGSTWSVPLVPDAVGDVGASTSLAEVDGRPAISYYDYTNADLKYVRGQRWIDCYLGLGDAHLAAGREYRLGFHEELDGPATVTLADVRADYEAGAREQFLLARDAYEDALTYAATPSETDEALRGLLDTYWELATGTTLIGNEFVVQALDVVFDNPQNALAEEIGQLQEAIDWYTQATGEYLELLASGHAADALALQPDRVHPISGDLAPYLDLQRLALASAKKSRAYLELAERQFRQFTPASRAEAEATLRQGFSLATAELALLDHLWDGAADDASYHTLLRNMSDLQRLFEYLREGKNPFGYGPEFVPFHFDPDNLPDNNYEQTKSLADVEKDNAETQVTNAVGRQEEADDNWVILQQRLLDIRSQFDSQLAGLCGTTTGGEPDLDWCHQNSGGQIYHQLLRVENANQRIELVLQQMENQNALIRIEQVRAAKVAGIQRATAELIDPETSEKYSDLMSQQDDVSRTKDILGGVSGFLNGIITGAGAGASFGAKGALIGGIFGGLAGIPGLAGACLEEGPTTQEKQMEFQAWQQAQVQYAEADITDAESEALIKQYMLRFKEYDIELSIALNNLQQELARLDALKTQVEYLLAEKAKAVAFTVALYQDPAGRVMRDYYMELAHDRFGVALDYADRAGRALEYEINWDPPYQGLPLTDLDDLYGTRDIFTLDAALAQMNTAYNDWKAGRVAQSTDDVVYLSQAVGFEDAYDPDLGRLVTREEKFNAFVRDRANWVDLDDDGEEESLRFTFQTSIFLGNRFFSANLFNDKIESIQVRVRGANLGDDEASILLRQSGTSFIRTENAFQGGGSDDVRRYNVSPLTARIEVAVDDNPFPQANQELATRSVAFTNWTLTLDTEREPKNSDLDIESIEEIEMHITHEAYTLQTVQRDLDSFEALPNRPYRPIEKTSSGPAFTSPLNHPTDLAPPDQPGSTDLTDSYIGTVAINDPLYLPVLDLVVVLTDTNGSLSGYVDSAQVVGYPVLDEGTGQGPALSGSWSVSGLDLQSEVYASPPPTVTRQVILHTEVITGNGEILTGEYSETLWGLTPEPLEMSGTFELHRGPRLARRVYLDRDATGASDGTSWGDAFIDLQSALTAARPGDEIWVAEGTYLPTARTDPTDPRSATFQLKNGVALYGGFAGTEMSLEQRDWVAHETILSGDIGTPEDNSDNVYHVVTGSGTDASAVLDGFTVSGGNADGDGNTRGGGMYNVQGSPTVRNVVFSHNVSQGQGGGMHNGQSSPTLTHVSFNDNSTGDRGGGMHNIYNSSPTLTDVTFSTNSAVKGGGMFNNSSSPGLTNVIFIGNTAGYAGGGMFNADGSGPTLFNVTFSGNTAVVGGGVRNWHTLGQDPTLINVTFSGNTASQSGGGMYNYDSNPTLTNCILWGTGQIHNGSSTPTIAHSDVQGSGGSGAGWDANLGIDGGGNLDDDPLFADADGSDDIPGTIDDNLRLRWASPAIDKGSNDALPADTFDLDGDGDTDEPIPFDLDGNSRIHNGTVDMGAYEAHAAVFLPLVLKNAP
jgi:hypothetical protein